MFDFHCNEIKRLEGAIKALETLVETTQAEVAFEQAANVRLKENVASLEKLATRLKDELDVKSKQLEAAVSRAVEADIRASRADAEAKRCVQHRVLCISSSKAPRHSLSSMNSTSPLCY